MTVSGEISITGAAEFDGALTLTGIGGTSLLIDAGGTGVFDAASMVTLESNATVGDQGGAGTIDIDTDDFIAGMNMVIAGNSLAGSLADISGGLTVDGTLVLGPASLLDLSGSLDAAATTIATGGTLNASGATESFGALVDAGTLSLQKDVHADAANLILTGALRLGGNTALTGLSTAVIGGAGSLMVGQGGEFSASQVNAIGGEIAIAGSMQVTGNVIADTGMILNGGTLSAAAVTLGVGGAISGFGAVKLTGGTSKIALNGGDIVASGGKLALDGNVAVSSGSIAIAGSSALELMQGAGGQVLFEGLDAELILDDPAAGLAAVSGMVGYDVIDLPGIATSLVSDAGGIVSTANGSFALSVAAGQPAVQILGDGNGGALITLGGEMACFARGTRLLTPNGYVPVEAFKPGDPIITQAGAKKPVRWIGRRAVEFGPRTRAENWPVLVMPGALAPCCPRSKIRLSPSHALYLEGVLVPVMHLVNAATILRERGAGPVTWYHVELDAHEVIMADGLPVETYLDTGNRGQFQHESGVRRDAAKPFAPLVTGGPKLARIRRFVHETALRAGFTLVQDPMLRAIARDLTVPAEMSPARGGSVARFTLPPDAGRVLLLACSAAPADTDPDTDDRRELGICLRRPGGGRASLRLGAGWYEKAAGDKGIWMGGSGEVFMPRGVTELTLRLAAVAQSWRPPAAH